MSNHPIDNETIMKKVSSGRPFVLLNLLPGPKAKDGDQEFQNQLQMRHLAHLFEMEAAGYISVFGPVVYDVALIGIIIFNITDKDKIKDLMRDDPYIKDGYLTYTLHDFFTIPGQTIPG